MDKGNCKYSYIWTRAIRNVLIYEQGQLEMFLYMDKGNWKYSYIWRRAIVNVLIYGEGQL